LYFENFSQAISIFVNKKMEEILMRPAQQARYDFEEYLITRLDICLDAATRPSKIHF
jgi:hypothetical protein